MTRTLCWSDSKAAEGAEVQVRPGPPGNEGRARSGSEGPAGELQKAATGVRPPGGAGEGQSPADGGGASPAAAAGTERERDGGLRSHLFQMMDVNSVFLLARWQTVNPDTNIWKRSSKYTENNKASGLRSDYSQRSTC